MNILVLIPARGGSKGIPRKNIKILNNKPLIGYAIDVARQFVSDADICVSTDDDEIIKVVEEYGLKVPFKRPDELATDHSGSYGVMLHALEFFEKQGRHYDAMVLLQPTSPFRRTEDVAACIQQYEAGGFDMVVSVMEALTNPYYNCYLAKEDNCLKPLLDSAGIERRQDAPKAYEYNGACYVINTTMLKEKNLDEFERVGFVEMDRLHSIDLDTMLDWKLAELASKEGLI
ncbi:acylneuraminate cytidylyltransferase family protein [Bacteroides bouchesdurhonensis]